MNAPTRPVRRGRKTKPASELPDQIGWGDMKFSGDAKRPGTAYGCGDDKHSWGYDGVRAPTSGRARGEGHTAAHWRGEGKAVPLGELVVEDQLASAPA